MPVRGVDYFPSREHREWAMQYDRRLQRWIDAERRTNRDWQARPITQPENDAIYQTLLPEFNAWVERQNAEQQRLWNVPDLDISNLVEKEFDRPKLDPFKLNYDSLNEIQMRFQNTVITIKGHPFMVSDIRNDRNNRRRFMFLLSDERERNFCTSLDQIDDFRSVPPGFVQLDNYHAWMARTPARVNTQGLTGNNVLMKRVSTNDSVPCNGRQIVQAISTKGKTLKWSSAYLDLLKNGVIREMRLSDEVATFTKKNSDTVYVAYNGRVFGKVSDNVVKADDEDDLIQPWIVKHFRKVNMEVKNA